MKAQATQSIKCPNCGMPVKVDSCMQWLCMTIKEIRKRLQRKESQDLRSLLMWIEEKGTMHERDVP